MTARAARAVIVGDPTDEHVAAVLAHVEHPGTVLVDASSLAQRPYRFDRNGVALGSLSPRAASGAEDSCPELAYLDSRSRGWLRRLAPPDWQRHVKLDSREAAISTSWLTLLVAMVRTSAVKWLTGLEDLALAENKLVQYHAALSLDVPIPETSACSDRSMLPDELSSDLVVKPLGPGHYVDGTGEGRVVFTTPMSATDSKLDALGGAPFLVQRRVPAVQHLRIVTVKDRVWCASLDAGDLPTDWRQSLEAHQTFSHCEAPPEITEASLQMTRHFRLGYSSQDWIVDESGEPWFIDLNPAGQWLFLPSSIADPVSASIAEWLDAHYE